MLQTFIGKGEKVEILSTELMAVKKAWMGGLASAPIPKKREHPM